MENPHWFPSRNYLLKASTYVSHKLFGYVLCVSRKDTRATYENINHAFLVAGGVILILLRLCVINVYSYFI